jgi:hypothetical protein
MRTVPVKDPEAKPVYDKRKEAGKACAASRHFALMPRAY